MSDVGKGKSKRLDHAKAAGAFIAKEDHVAFHDKRLWDLRSKRDAQAHGMPEWETLRDLASGIKEHTLSNLADYLDQFITQAESHGVIVHYACDGGRAQRDRLQADVRARPHHACQKQIHAHR